MQGFLLNILAPYGILGLVAFIFFNHINRVLTSQMKQQESLLDSMLKRNTEDLVTIKNKIDSVLEAVSSHNVNANDSFSKINHVLNTDKVTFTDVKKNIDDNMTYMDNELDELKSYLVYFATLLTEARGVVDRANPDTTAFLNELMINGVLDKKKLDEYLKGKAGNEIEEKNFKRYKIKDSVDDSSKRIGEDG